MPSQHSVQPIPTLQPRQPGSQRQPAEGGQASREPGELADAGQRTGGRGLRQIPATVDEPQGHGSQRNADDDGRDVWTNQRAGWGWRQPVQAGRGLLRGFRNAHGSSVSNPRCDFVGPAVALLDRSSGVGGVLRKM